MNEHDCTKITRKINYGKVGCHICLVIPSFRGDYRMFKRLFDEQNGH